MAKKPKKTDEIVEIQEIQLGEVHMHLLGTTAMIMNRFAAKAWQELLFPSASQNRAALEQRLKHDPLAEYRGAIYLSRDTGRKTAVHVPTGAIHGALAAVAIDIPGTAKAKIERLTKVVDLTVDLYGVPQIFCAMVRNSDQNRTPDVRTRAIFPEWALAVKIQYVKSIVSERTVANLMGAAGKIIGIGDWRGQKGGPYGSFNVVAPSDKDYARIVKTQGRTAQLRAWEAPEFYDENTEELLEWFENEVVRREMDGQLSAFLTDAGRLAKKNGGGRRAEPKVPVVVVKGGDGKGGGEEYVATE